MTRSVARPRARAAIASLALAALIPLSSTLPALAADPDTVAPTRRRTFTS